MKISLHIDADTAEEFQTALNVMYATQTRNWLETTRNLAQRIVASQEPEPAPAPKPAPQPIPPQPEPQEPKPAPEPDEEDVPPVIAQEPVQAKRQRGRPRKERPAEAPVEAPAATAEAAQFKAEVAKNKEAGIETLRRTEARDKEAAIEVVSRQDLLDVFSEYVQRYGASFGFTDISTLLQKHLGDGVRRASDVPEQQLTQAIGAIRQAIAENPFNRKRDYNA